MSGWDIGMCFNRRGEPISFMEATILLGDIDKRRVAQTFIGDEHVMVSTVHLPFAQPPWDEERAPLIFETMVFTDQQDVMICARYATEAEALDGHNRIVESLRLRPEALDQLMNEARQED